MLIVKERGWGGGGGELLKESYLNTALSSIWTKSYVYVSKTTILDLSIYIIYNFMALCQEHKKTRLQLTVV